MQVTKERILNELNTAIESVTEAAFQLSETDDTQIDYKDYERADDKLEEAFELMTEAKNIIMKNMKGE